MPRIRGLVTRPVRAGAAPPSTLPPVMTRIRPCTTPVMPSVITSGGIPRSVIPSPFVAPIRSPTPSAMASASSAWSFWPSPILKTSMAPSVITAPTDRSIPSPPLIMTSVCPAATIPRKAASLKMFIACP